MTGENRVNNVVVYDSPELAFQGGNIEASVLLQRARVEVLKMINAVV
jgi:hypothetical protein